MNYKYHQFLSFRIFPREVSSFKPHSLNENRTVSKCEDLEQGQKEEGKRLDDDERKEILEEEVRGREEERRILPGGVKKLSPSETVNDSIFKQ